MARINWFNLDRASLYSYFYSLRGKVVGRSLTPDHIHLIIRKHVKDVLPIRIKKHIDPKIKQGYVYTGGVYYSNYDKKKKPAIEVNFSYHPDDVKLKLTDYRWKRMAVRFADVVLHEIIHMRQYRARKFKDIPGYQSTAASTKERKEQEYYGDTDEMGAFSFNIACELVDRFGYDPSAINQYINSNASKRHSNSWWFNYLKYFGWNHEHKIIRRMKRKIMRNLENAYYGKPFKTTNHLTY